MPTFAEALQADPTPVIEPDRRCLARQLAHNIGDQHFAALRQRSDSRRCVDRATDRVGVGVECFAGIDSETHPWSRTVRCTLRRQCERDGLEWRSAAMRT